ncbi:MAG: hypothetical protein WCI34_03925 [Actinomycetes bacterium]
MSDARRQVATVGCAGLLVAGVAWLIVTLSGAQTGYDSSWHLLWADQIEHGLSPRLDVWAAPTEHPLLLAIAMLSAPFGLMGGANTAFLTLTLTALFVLLPVLWKLGREIFGAGLAGGVAWLLMIGSYGLLLQAMRGYLDVWFLLLVSSAGLLIAQRRSPTAGWLPLLLAGLLRPEAWLLAALAAALGWRGATRGRRVLIVAAVIAPPAIWFGLDWSFTGDALLSLRTAHNLAVDGGGGVLSVVGAVLLGGIRGPATLLGLLGLWLAWTRVPRASLAIPVALIGTGAAMAALIAVGGLTLLPRYLLLCDLGLALLAGYALGGWANGSPQLNQLWRTAGVGCLIAGSLIALFGVGFKLRDEIRIDRQVHADLAGLLNRASVRKSLTCGPLTFPSFRLIPDAKLLLGDPVANVRGRAQEPSPKRGVAVTIFFEDVDQRIADRYGHPGINLPIDEARPPGFKYLEGNDTFSAFGRCG